MLWTKGRQVGIRIDDSSIEIAVGKGSPEDFSLYRSQQISLPDGVIRAGKIVEPETLTQVLQEALASERKKKTHLVVPGRFSVMKQLELPDLPKKKLHELVTFELAHSIHLPFQNPIFDLIKIGDVPPGQESENMASYMIFAAPSDVVESYAKAVTDAGLQVASIEMSLFSIARVIRSHSSHFQAGTYMVIDITAHGSEIMIYHNGVICFKRYTPIEGAHYDSEGSLQVSAFTKDLMFDIERSMSFFRHSLGFREQKLNAMYMTGTMSQFADIMITIEAQLGIPVYSALPSNWAEQGVDVVALGLAMKEGS